MRQLTIRTGIHYQDMPPHGLGNPLPNKVQPYSFHRPKDQRTNRPMG
jgi:hypothetical protein